MSSWLGLRLFLTLQNSKSQTTIYIVAHRNTEHARKRLSILACRRTPFGDLRSTEKEAFRQMGRWMKPEIFPLLAAMTFVTSMCIFQLSRNLFLNPDVRVNKAHRNMGVLENQEEGEKYAEHGLRRFLRTRPPEIMPTINHFFSEHDK